MARRALVSERSVQRASGKRSWRERREARAQERVRLLARVNGDVDFGGGGEQAHGFEELGGLAGSVRLG